MNFLDRMTLDGGDEASWVAVIIRRSDRARNGAGMKIRARESGADVLRRRLTVLDPGLILRLAFPLGNSRHAVENQVAIRISRSFSARNGFHETQPGDGITRPVRCVS